MNVIKVFQLDDIEWWAGESLEACVAEGRRQCGDDCYPDDGVQGEVSSEAMQRLRFVDEDGTFRTFAEELEKRVAADETFPQMFACEDY
jgi:hypothetical protein